MKALRCIGVLLLCLPVLLSVESVWAAEGSPKAQATQAKAAAKAVKTPAKAKPVAKPKAKPQLKAKTTAAARKAAKQRSAEVIATPVPKAELDLSLPHDMVKDLQPPGQVEAQVRKPLLPEMFGEKPSVDSPFQLNGRLLSNEMGLQLRNDARQQEVEGAAIEFQFKQ